MSGVDGSAHNESGRTDKVRRRLDIVAIAALVVDALGVVIAVQVPLLSIPVLFVGLILGVVAVLEIGAIPSLYGRAYAWFAIVIAFAVGCWRVGTFSIRYPYGNRCLSNLHIQASALSIYAEDYNRRLPMAVNWCDVVKTKSRGGVDFQTCPALPKGQKGGYAFNSALSSHMTPIAGDTNPVLIFESDPGWNRYGQREILLREPRPNHGDGFAFAFADGHVKWIGKSKTTTVRWNPAQATQPVARKKSGAIK